MAKDPTPKEIREAFSDYSQASSHIRDEGKIDMRFASGDPWDPEDRLAREDARRPVMNFDELNQYLVQWTGAIRENPRAVQISPESEDSDPKDAENRANTIRGIEHKSNAQAVYTSAGDSMVMRSYGFARINKQLCEGKSFDQELVIKPILNPDTVIYSPNYRMPDGSDVDEAFEIDILSRKEFKRKYPNAKQQSFSGEDMKIARNWIREDDIQIAGFWKAHIEVKNLLLVETEAHGDAIMWEDELMGEFNGRDKLGKFSKLRDVINVKREIKKERRRVVQYVTNGIEIIDKIEWDGQRIPLPACFGKQLFMDMDGGPKRHLFSMIRLARDAQMFLAYAVSQEAEELGQTPKAPFVGAKGQFESAQEAWETISKVPRGYLEYDVVVNEADSTPLPPPARPQYEPHIDTYEQAKESSRQSVRSAIGLAQLPTAAQRMTEKSGVALDKIMKMEQVGMLHFFDNYNQFIGNVGWQMNDLLGPTYDTARTVPIVKPDGTKGLLRLNDDQYTVQPGQPKMDVLHTSRGRFGVIVDVGPSHESEQNEVQELTDTILANLATFQVPPEISQKIMAKAIRMRNLGQAANDIADLFDPPQDTPIPDELQGQFAQLQATVAKLTQENQALLLDRAGKAQELEHKEKIEGIRQVGEDRRTEMTNIVKLVVAELAKQSKALDTQAQADTKQALGMEGFRQKEASASADRKHQLDLAHHQAAHDVAMVAIQPPPPPAGPGQTRQGRSSRR